MRFVLARLESFLQQRCKLPFSQRALLGPLSTPHCLPQGWQHIQSSPVVVPAAGLAQLAAPAEQADPVPEGKLRSSWKEPSGLDGIFLSLLHQTAAEESLLNPSQCGEERCKQKYAELIIQLFDQGRSQEIGPLVKALQRVLGEGHHVVLIQALDFARQKKFKYWLVGRLKLLARALTLLTEKPGELNLRKELCTAAVSKQEFDQKVLYKVVKFLSNRDGEEQALLLLKYVQYAGWVVDEGCCVPLLVRACQARSPELVRTIHQLLNELKLDWRKVFGLAVRVLSVQLQDLDSAEQMPALMAAAGVPASSNVFNALVSACNKAGLRKRAQQWYKMMQQAHLQPDLWTWNQQLAELCKEGIIEEAVAFVRMMRSKGVEPDACTYTTLMSAYVKSGDAGSALSLFQFLRRGGLAPTLQTWNVVVQGLCQRREVEQAEAVVAFMGRAGVKPSVVTYTILIHAWGKAKEAERAEGVFEQMLSAGIKANDRAWHALLLAYCRCENVAAGEAIMHRARREGLEPDSYMFTSLIAWWGRLGCLGDAVRVFSEMGRSRTGVTITACNALLTAYCRAGLLQEAEAVLPQMQAAGIEPNAHTLSILAAFLPEAGQQDRNSNVVDSVHTGGH